MTTANAIRGLMPSVLQVKSREDLPDDVEKLKDMVLAALSSNDELAQQVAWLKRVLWGKKSERIASPEQEDLFQQARERLGLVPADPADEQHEFISPEDCPGAAESEPSAATDDKPSEDGQGAAESRTDKANVDKPKPVMPKGPVKTKRGGAREKKRGSFLGGTVPANTPVVTTHVCLDGATCPVCAMPLTLLGADSRKRVEYVPGRFIIQETVVETGICLEHPHGSIFTPEVPEVIIPGGVLGNELAVNIIVDKFADGIPLHRQARRFERKGVHIPTSTLSRNVIAAAALAGHIVNAMRDELIESPWLQGDATGFPVLVGDLGKAHSGQLWVYSNGASAVFQCSMTKHGDIPRDFLEGFRGVWLSDGASNYNEVEDLDGVERGGCWSHGRRYVFEARNDHLAAMEGLELIRDLFMSERVAMTLAIPERQAHRDAIAAPLVERIRVWVATWRADVDVQRRPKSAFAKAVNYLHRQWAALTLFLSKPMIEIHNNRSELLLRGPVTGRHAWLFAGSPNGAEASAIWFSLVASCMLQGVDPAVYLRAVLPGLSKKTPTQVRALTPAKWAEARRTEGAVA